MGAVSHAEMVGDYPDIDYFARKLEDRDYDEKELAMALAGLPAVAAA